MITFLFVVIAIAILILVHEWGHFYSARKLGVKVEEFGFGFPPRLYSRMKHGVRYSFNALPFGGFVKIFGEHGEGEGDKKSFVSRPAWQRFIILGAGVGMNLVAAWVFFSLGSLAGVPQLADGPTDGIPVSVIAVLPDSPADRAGIKFGDQILEMRSDEVSLRIEREKDVRDFVDAYRGEEVTLVIRRAGEIKEIRATPRASFPEGEGPLGIAMGRLMVEKTVWYLAPFEGLKTLGRSIGGVIEGFGAILKELVVERKTSVSVSGPVGIFFFADDMRSLGAAYFFQFIGILSVNLAVLNFLPIPALDGGRILFLAIEKIKGKRIKPEIENLVHGIGFAFLVLVMILVTYHDLARIF